MTTDSLIRELVSSGAWSEEAVRLGIRANFRCEYCSCSFLDSVEHYKAWECDHIVPHAHGGGDEFDNLALACRTCNWCLKRDWDPRTATGSGATRDALIAAVRDHLAEKRRHVMDEIDRVHRLWASVQEP